MLQTILQYQIGNAKELVNETVIGDIPDWTVNNPETDVKEEK